MTVEQLRKKLKKLPPKMPVYVAQSSAHDHKALENVVRYEWGRPDDYLLLAGGSEDTKGGKR